MGMMGVGSESERIACSSGWTSRSRALAADQQADVRGQIIRVDRARIEHESGEED
jgi:hypothetical protein